jgi:hypothetical protein
MGHLQGLNSYLNERYHHSVFDQALESKEPWELHLHNHLIITTRIVKNQKYDLEIEDPGDRGGILPKINVKLLYPVSSRDVVMPLIKTNDRIKDLNLEPILPPGGRYHIKNKSLFPLMHEKEVLFFILLEGEIIRGIVADFSRYDITVKLKDGSPITILRHAMYDLRDKRKRCFLKSFQEKHKDWKKSSLYVSSPSQN